MLLIAFKPHAARNGAFVAYAVFKPASQIQLAVDLPTLGFFRVEIGSVEIGFVVVVAIPANSSRAGIVV